MARNAPSQLTGAIILLLAASFHLAACGRDDPAHAGERSEGSSRPVVTDGSREHAGEAVSGLPRLGDEPVVPIGVADGAEEYMLHGVPSAMRTGDGRIVLANRGTYELRWYDAEGRFLWSAGRRGEGPGEFRWLTWATLFEGDSVLAYDSQLRRASIFSPAGEFVRVVSLASEGRRLSKLVGRFSDGTLLVQWRERRGFTPDDRSRILADTLLYLRVDERGTPLDTVARIVDASTFLNVDGLTVSFATLRFAPRPAVHVHRDRVYVAPAESYGVEIVEFDGERRRVRADRPNRPVTAEAIRRFEEEERAEARREEDRPELERRLAALPHPDRMPAYARILIDAEDHLWIEEYRAPGEDRLEWSVFDFEGNFVEIVRVPAGLRLLDIGRDHVLGRRVDELGVERIEMYEVRRGQGQGQGQGQGGSQPNSESRTPDA